MDRIIEISVVSALAAVSFILGILQLCERGVPINNAYLFASKDDKPKIDKSPLFRQSGIVFLLLGVVFAFVAAAVAFDIKLLSKIGMAIAAVTVIYAIASELVIIKKSK